MRERTKECEKGIGDHWRSANSTLDRPDRQGTTPQKREQNEAQSMRDINRLTNTQNRNRVTPSEAKKKETQNTNHRKETGTERNRHKHEMERTLAQARSPSISRNLENFTRSRGVVKLSAKVVDSRDMRDRAVSLFDGPRIQ